MLLALHFFINWIYHTRQKLQAPSPAA